jgi:hypothetical protein
MVELGPTLISLVDVSEKSVWQLLKECWDAAGVSGIAVHPCRCTCTKLCRAARGESEQIQMMLG